MIFFVETVKTWFSYSIILLTSCYGNVHAVIDYATIPILQKR